MPKLILEKVQMAMKIQRPKEQHFFIWHLDKTQIKAYTQFGCFFLMNPNPWITERHIHINDGLRISVKALELLPVKEGTEKLM